MAGLQSLSGYTFQDLHSKFHQNLMSDGKIDRNNIPKPRIALQSSQLFPIMCGRISVPLVLFCTREVAPPDPAILHSDWSD